MSKNCCTEETKVSKVKVEENGKKAVFLNPQKNKYKKTRVDGCLIKNKTSCDFLVSSGDDGVLIELKGCDVSHALDQIEQSFVELHKIKMLSNKMAALIVCQHPGSHPKFTTKVQKSKERIFQKFKSPLHISSSNKEYEIDKLVEFS